MHIRSSILDRRPYFFKSTKGFRRLTVVVDLYKIIEKLLGSSVAEQVTVNHLVAGSNPARAAIS